MQFGTKGVSHMPWKLHLREQESQLEDLCWFQRYLPGFVCTDLCYPGNSDNPEDARVSFCDGYWKALHFQPSLLKDGLMSMCFKGMIQKLTFFLCSANQFLSKHTQVPLRGLGLGLTPDHFSFSWNLITSAETFLVRDWEGQNEGEKENPSTFPKGWDVRGTLLSKKTSKFQQAYWCLVTIHIIL